jgi:uncharacterized protein YdeI (YjbR/CyaY-like superfamily)
VGFYKKDSGKPSITWAESVDLALCFGWIDGIRRRVDDVSHTIRFTPRRPGSRWSTVNIKRVAELEAQGLMKPAGLEAFRRRQTSRVYSYEQRYAATLDPDHEKKLKADKKAWAFFQAQPPSYPRTMIYWVVSAKRPETRLKRLDSLIQACAKGRRQY